MTDPRIYELVSDLYSYPDEGYAERWLTAIAVLREEHEAVAASLQVFIDETANKSLDQMEELYTRTFDLDPSATLDIGWHLWGEAYERGRFLARMRERLAETGIEEDGELPDHLRYILRFIPCLREEQRDWWVNQYPLMAMGKILAALEKGASPHRHLVAATQTLLAELHPRTRVMEIVDLTPIVERNADHFDETGTPVGHADYDPTAPGPSVVVKPGLEGAR